MSDKNDVVFDGLNDLKFITVNAEDNNDLNMDAAFLDLEEEDDDSLPIVYIDNEEDEILSPFTGKPDIYMTHKTGVYGCIITDKEFRVELKEEN